MKEEIVQRLQALGGNIDDVTGHSLQEDILSIAFSSVLYKKPYDTPWASAEDEEPIYSLGDFIESNKELISTDRKALYEKIIEKYYCLTEEGYGQMFWSARLFTPLKEGSDDFKEWNSIFSDEEEIDLKEIIALTGTKTPDFIQLFYCYGFPDHVYICTADPNPENPTVFGTDHEVFFSEVRNLGTLEDLLNQCMTKEELLDLVEARLKAV